MPSRTWSIPTGISPRRICDPERPASMLKLHYAPGTIAAAVAITLHEAEVDYDRQRIDFSHSEQKSPGYLAINPKGRVPALETPRGVLTETAAILEFIAATYPQAGLVPTDPF